MSPSRHRHVHLGDSDIELCLRGRRFCKPSGRISAFLREGDLGRNTEARAEHALLRSNVPHVVNGHFPLLIRVSKLELDTDLGVDAFENVIQGYLVVALEGEAVNVDHGQLRGRVRFEELLVSAVNTLVVVHKGVSRSW